MKESVKEQNVKMSEYDKKERLAAANQGKSTNIEWSDYFKSRRKRMKKEFLDELQQSAKSDFVEIDAYGAYREGTFLHRSCVVKVGRDEDNGLWVLQIISEQPITLPIIKQVRYKYLPNDMMVCLMLPPRENESKNSVMLYEMPINETGEE